MLRLVRHTAFVFLLVVAMLATTTSALAQVQIKDPAVFDPIPAESRAKLIERLSVVFELQRKGDWEKLYDFVLAEDKPANKDEYVRRMKAWTGRMRLKRFTPDSISTQIYSVEGTIDTSRFGMFIICGCGENGWGWFKEKYATSITARLENGVWFFSDFAPIFEAVDGPLMSCRKPKRPSEPKDRKK